MKNAPNFKGPSNPAQGNGKGTTFSNPTGQGLQGMAGKGQGCLMSNSNYVVNRNMNQGSQGGPNFKGVAGNPVSRGK